MSDNVMTIEELQKEIVPGNYGDDAVLIAQAIAVLASEVAKLTAAAAGQEFEIEPAEISGLSDEYRNRYFTEKE